MKISFVKFKDAVRLVDFSGSQHNTFLNDKFADIELIEFSHFKITCKKNPEKLLAIVPFSNSAFCNPSVDESVPLEEVAETIEPAEPDDITARFPVSGKKGNSKVKNGPNKGTAT